MTTQNLLLITALSFFGLHALKPTAAQAPKPSLPKAAAAIAKSSATLRSSIAASPLLPFVATPFVVYPPTPGWHSGAVSWVTVDPHGNIYELQRGESADPILVLDPNGHLLRSWGKGAFTIPHSIRLDPAGNVWTVDAGSSTLIKWSPLGKKLLNINVGERPANGNPFNGTTDIAFAPNGHLFITDGYGNARVLEYTADGHRLRQWGTPGTDPGQFHLPHAIQIGPSPEHNASSEPNTGPNAKPHTESNGTLYIADRENGRIQRFDLSGHDLGNFSNLGRVYSLHLAGPILWIGTGPLDQPTGAPGWLLKLDARTGKILGHLDLPDPHSGHSIALTPSGEPIATVGDHLLWFKPK